ncbi:MAG TPA: glucans biosynthesis glucosyltransferase MdoH [Methylobacterium sp.]|uniref:glucans biosynthesis glucosyltransferase MdoH n=1 Tax=Methylorubrum sp. B1-46 TaxID=2897334 RepID=UPI001E2C3620|nr:glucans biosynthesis glucosyltransferase MdoH [Methylorubrum sp. B1-46]UGB24127.1 glucans biosynthesis glucosyltransferase MdoH [Methylorubrum sp. B1-46]HEV2541699.1 glucans biosynthesis glucosyltransferase MdoH [Methylobacterium sp.]
MSSPDLPQAERSVETGAGGETHPRGAGPAPRPTSFRLRRLALAGPTLATAAAIAALALAAYGLPETWLGRTVLGLFVVLMAWQSFTAWQYLYGLIAALMGNRALSPLERRAATISTRPTGLSRTAAVVAIHAEDPIAVFAAIRVMARSLQREGGDGSDIDIFVLSDTREGAISAVEEHEFARIQAWAEREGRGMPRIRYRRRTENTGRKAGNIAEFCQTYGPEYDFMIVLDADSLMTGAAMRRLARLMEENPRTSLIQTVSYAAGRDTLFARIQQFAVRLYAPLSLRCLETWQGPDGSYWGHNAILRIEAFANNAELPVLSGRPPLGGEILCHDIVEGALLRRAGWEVRLLPDMGGTWEEMPTNLIDLLGRERRWCQGNLQHIRVLPMKGLLGASRWHLGVGILGYCVYPLWIAFLGLGTWEAARSGELGLIGYGIDGGNVAAWSLAALVIAIMALPKLLSLGYVLASPQRRADFGGTRSLLVSAALEQAIWVLLWPVMALFAAGAVMTTLVGRVVRWDAQSRDDRSVPWSEAFRLQSDAVAAGGALAVLLAFSGSPWLALWMAPVAVALLTSPAQSVLTSSTRLGLGSKARGLFLTEDDTRPAPELLELHHSRTAGTEPAALAGTTPPWLPVSIDEAGASTLR